MQRTGWLSLALVVGLLCGAAPLLARDNKDHGAAKAAYAAGFPWTDMDFNRARKSLKPVAVFIYDPAAKPNNAAENLADNVFSKVGRSNKKGNYAKDDDMLKGLDGLLFAMVPADSTAWPAQILGLGRGGAALIVLTSDGHFDSARSKGEFVTLAKDALARNPGIALKYKDTPPPDWVPPGAPAPNATPPGTPKAGGAGAR